MVAAPAVDVRRWARTMSISSGAAADRHERPELDPAAARPTLGPEAEAAVATLLRLCGEAPDREGLAATPRRVAETLAALTSGYGQDLDAILRGAIFEERYDEMVLVKDIELYSLCEHHLLPFHGVVHVAYIPRGRIVGLGTLPRVVEVFARRLQVQERLTTEIAETLQRYLEPRGVAVVIEASQLCMSMRGVAQRGSRTVTSCMTGIFRQDPRTRGELLSLIRPTVGP